MAFTSRSYKAGGLLGWFAAILIGFTAVVKFSAPAAGMVLEPYHAGTIPAMLKHTSGTLDRLGRLINDDGTPVNPNPPVWGPPPTDGFRIPMKITNMCDSTLWPAIYTQGGTGPGVGGFALKSGESNNLWLGGSWVGRVWARTNCTDNGNSFTCKTRDCNSILNCLLTGDVPATLAELNMQGGSDNNQAWYDISLVDGYNVPLGIRFLPFSNLTGLPPNLVDPACIATPGWLWAPATSGTIYSNASYPIPWESTETNESLLGWCPEDLLEYPAEDSYPDGNGRRPTFSPCLSRCARSGDPAVCCTPPYNNAAVCKPSEYSLVVKKICPDAYSYAYDDSKAGFVIPVHRGGFETIFCPRGRSTNIMKVLMHELSELAETGELSEESLRTVQDTGYVDSWTSTGDASTSGAAGRMCRRRRYRAVAVGCAFAAIVAAGVGLGGGIFQ